MIRNHLDSSSRYILISAKPAPNGGLHLGHIAGPYLRQDMLRRHYQMRGATVHVVGGTDPIDSFIALRASQVESGPDAVAVRYFAQIEQDFNSLDIHFDAFIDPLSDRWRDQYRACFADVVERAVAEDRVATVQQDFPFFPGSEQGASGAWICGLCPDCACSVSGYFCEACGAHFDPSMILEPVLRGTSERPDFRAREDLFFPVTDPSGLLSSLKAMGVPDSLRAIVERHFENGRSMIRLSERSQWGVPIDENDPAKELRYFGHGLLYGYCRLLGDVYCRISDDPVNPFDSNSTVTSVNLFGVDNTVSHMVNIQAIGHEIEGWKGFDGFVVNRFYLLEGRKFSTSARHLIWVHDLVETAGADSDSVRFTIAATSPTWAERNLRVDEVLHWCNEIFGKQIRDRVTQDIHRLSGSEFVVPDHATLDAFAAVWDRICEGHAFPVYAPEEQVELILSWLNARPSPDSADAVALSTWLRCLLITLYPVVPRFASWAWTSLGLDGSPSLMRLLCPASVAPVSWPQRPAELTEAALHSAMPDTAVAWSTAAKDRLLGASLEV